MCHVELVPLRLLFYPFTKTHEHTRQRNEKQQQPDILLFVYVAATIFSIPNNISPWVNTFRYVSMDSGSYLL